VETFAYDYRVRATDPNGDGVSYTLTVAPAPDSDPGFAGVTVRLLGPSVWGRGLKAYHTRFPTHYFNFVTVADSVGCGSKRLYA
jgi:hypothetical protein